MKLNKKILSMILSVAMVSSVLPTANYAAFADELENTEATETVETTETTEGEATGTEITEGETTEGEITEGETTEGETTEGETTEGETTEGETPVEESNVTVVSDTDKIYAGENYTVEYKVVNQYSGGYNAEVIVTNTSDATLYDWNVEFALNGEVRNLWNGQVADNTDGVYSLQNNGWNRNLKAGESVTIGIAVGYTGELTLPENCAVVTGEKADVDSRYTVDFDVLDDWEIGYTGQISLTNNTDKDLEDWTFEFDFDSNIEGFWDAEILSHEGTHYVIKNVGYNSTIKAGQTLKLGFTSNPGNVTVQPENFDLLGATTAVDWSEILNVTGSVKDAASREGMEGVTLVADGEASYPTDSEGKYNIPLTTTDAHILNISKDGYIPVNYYDLVAEEGKLDLDDVILIPDAFENVSGVATGNVVNRATGAPVPNATVNIRKGINNTRGEIIDTMVSGSAGEFATSPLLNGSYTIEVKGENIETYYLVVNLAGTNIPIGNLRVVVNQPVGDLGKISGSILEAGSNNALQGATITVDGMYTYTSDAEGRFNIDVTADDVHTFVISKDGYLTVNYYGISVGKNQTYNLSTILQIIDPNPGSESGTTTPVHYTSTAVGRTTNATTGAALSGVVINVREGLNNKDGAIIKTVTSGSNGSFSIPDLEYGNYTLELTGNNVVKANYSITCFQPTQNLGDLSVSPKMQSNQMRIVLTWGANPSDLDSHFIGQSMHVYYPQKVAQGAVLDVDDTSSYGPETVTLDLNKLAAGTYTYYVHWFAGSGTWRDSNAKVTVYSGDSVIREYYVPSNLSQSNKQWNVFKFNTQTREITDL